MQIQRQKFSLNALRYFEAAARHLSLAKAAEDLCVTYSAVSHQIRSLESSLNVSLFDRRKKPMQLTPEGKYLFRTLVVAFDDINRAASEMAEAKISGELRIACTPSLAFNWLTPLLGEFFIQFPQIQIHLNPTFKSPRLLKDHDLIIAYGEPREFPGRRIAAVLYEELIPVVSPKLLNSSRPLKVPKDLLDQTLLHDDDGLFWDRWLSSAGVHYVQPLHGHYFRRAHLALTAAIKGYGVAICDLIQIEHNLHEGNLICPFKQTVPLPHPYFLLAPEKIKMTLSAREMEALIINEWKQRG